jgi:histidine triad (HIT) family protein
MDCLFCKIAAGQIPAKKVYEDDRLVAFRDINPQAPVHVLIIPRKHVASLNAITAEDESLMGALTLAAQKIARDEGVADGGWRAVLNTGKDGGQTVFHVHLHVLGGRPLGWPPG